MSLLLLVHSSWETDYEGGEKWWKQKCVCSTAGKWNEKKNRNIFSLKSYLHCYIVLALFPQFISFLYFFKLVHLRMKRKGPKWLLHYCLFTSPKQNTFFFFFLLIVYPLIENLGYLHFCSFKCGCDPVAFWRKSNQEKTRTLLSFQFPNNLCYSWRQKRLTFGWTIPLSISRTKTKKENNRNFLFSLQTDLHNQIVGRSLPSP